MAATEAAAMLPPEAILERERRTSPRAGLAALGAAIFTVGSTIGLRSISTDQPPVYVLDSVREAAGESIGRSGLRSAQLLFLDDHATGLVLASVAQAVATLLTMFVLLHLLGAALDRGANVPRFARMLVLFGGVASAVAVVGTEVARAIATQDFATSSDQSTQAARDALSGAGYLAFGLIQLIGALTFAGGCVMVAVAAMRVGLLTRFVGILGAIVGVLLILGPGASFTILSFWLVMVGALLFGKWPTGVPEAWTRGVAVPWPTQQQIREQREAARAPAAAAEPHTEAPSPATSARKKKKRRP